MLGDMGIATTVRQILACLAAALLIPSLAARPASAQEKPKEEDYYRIVPLPIPENVVLEVGGLEMMPDGKLAVSTRRGTPGLDLRAGIADLLRRAGIPEVVQDPRCTVEDPLLFSHRRDGVTGRQAGLVWLS